MRRIWCSICNKPLGWMNDTGPCGSFYCDECKEGSTDD